jgi:hypothetical protein
MSVGGGTNFVTEVLVLKDEPDRTEYFYQCPLCGQWVDGRDIDQVHLHQQSLPHPPGQTKH